MIQNNETEYLIKLERRINDIETNLLILDEKLKDKQIELKRIRNTLHEASVSTSNDIIDLNKEFKNLVNSILQKIDIFKIACRKSDLKRVKMKSEMWAPERFITKNQFRIMLEEEDE